MAKVQARVLCPRCLESFTSEMDAGRFCPDCVEREAERSAQAEAIGERTGVVTEVPEFADDTVAITAPPTTLTEAIIQFFPRQIREAREWSKGRLGWFRLLLWLYLAWTFGRHFGSSEPYRSMFDGINLGIHEIGHAIFRPFGMTLMAAGGTIAQLAAPIAGLFIFRWQKDFFGISVALCWLATNLWGISVYLGDARAQVLPLVSPGMGLMPGGDTSGMGGVIHDWNYLLGPPGLLKYDTIIAGAIATAAVITMLVGLGFGAWLIVRMLLSKTSSKLDWDNFS
jgi:hypothetical protein